MSDEMKVQQFDVLLRWILREFQENESIFGPPDHCSTRPIQMRPTAARCLVTTWRPPSVLPPGLTPS